MPVEQCENQEQQQWIVVTKNKNKHKGSIKNKQIHNRGSQNLFSSQNKEEYIRKFITSKPFEFNSKLISQTVEKVQAMSNLSSFHVECLGLGNFLSNKKSFVQLQFLEEIILPISKKILLKREHKEILQKSQRPLFTQEELSVNVFDPCFSKSEIKHIQEKDYVSVQKFQLQSGKINVFFMPHCQRFLYQAVYEMYQKVEQKNMTPLIVIGNSIQQYKQRCTLVQQKIPSIFLKITVVEEKVFDYENALNDTFVLI